MRNWSKRLFVLPAVLIVGLAAGACGASASSPTAPVATATIGAGDYSLIIFGTSMCLSGSGTAPAVSSAAIRVVLSSTAAFDVWRVSVPGQSLTGEVALVNGQVQGWLRGSAASDAVRLSTGATPDAALAMESTKAGNGRYEGPVLVGNPRYEGIGAAGGSYTTCSTNAFLLQPA
jgi:hypothetical protein